jgi:hypothetical protein
MTIYPGLNQNSAAAFRAASQSHRRGIHWPGTARRAASAQQMADADKFGLSTEEAVELVGPVEQAAGFLEASDDGGDGREPVSAVVFVDDGRHGSPHSWIAGRGS